MWRVEKRIRTGASSFGKPYCGLAMINKKKRNSESENHFSYFKRKHEIQEAKIVFPNFKGKHEIQKAKIIFTTTKKKTKFREHFGRSVGGLGLVRLD